MLILTIGLSISNGVGYSFLYFCAGQNSYRVAPRRTDIASQHHWHIACRLLFNMFTSSYTHIIVQLGSILCVKPTGVKWSTIKRTLESCCSSTTAIDSYHRCTITSRTRQICGECSQRNTLCLSNTVFIAYRRH